jgi:PTS system nitrogen regulatory IIA component
MVKLLEVMLGRLSKHGAYAGIAWEGNRERPATEYGTGHNDSGEISRVNVAAQLLSSEDILLDLDVSTKERVFEEVGRLFERRHGLPQTQVVESLNAREKLGSTGLGQGVALPHARIKTLQQAVAAFVRMKLPIVFDAPDGKPVWGMLILLVPERATEQHLQILAEFAQMFGDSHFRERLRMCDDAGAVYQLMSQWPIA